MNRKLLIGCCLLFIAGISQAQKKGIIYTGAVWPDKDGNHIQAHGTL